ncbi:MAG TPA: cobyrinate a,c-diamide synthase [Candidatus Binataceae bacterium]|nr:cobyrinate a,c-diamide synthase [Candidatus Binataceae bacterium]
MASTPAIPRVLLAATGSGAGKTTAVIALIGALRARGMRVAAFKCGPDYLDPTYHRRAAGAPSHNLDGWMMGREAVLSTFARAADGADIAVIEGMMGLFDGVAPERDEGSTAEIAKWLDAPVLLVVDASGMARTVAALAAGFKRFDPRLNLAGLLCNRVGGRGHLDLLRTASAELPVLGGFPAEPRAAFPERHLGLLSADDKSVAPALFAAWTVLAAEWLDLDAIVELARAAPPLAAGAEELWPRRGADAPRCRIGVAHDAAFHFYYEDNLRRLELAGAELVRFAPTRDRELPQVDGLYFGGGYPEACARELSGNQAMLDAVRGFVRRGGPIYAECGGLMYLADAIRTLDGRRWPMAGIVGGEAVMADRLQALGYVEVETRADSIVGPAGMRLRGHQFRYSTLKPAPPARFARVYSVSPRWGGATFDEGYRTGGVLASYVHVHWASNPQAAGHFVDSCARWRANRMGEHGGLPR